MRLSRANMPLASQTRPHSQSISTNYYHNLAPHFRSGFVNLQHFRHSQWRNPVQLSKSGQSAEVGLGWLDLPRLEADPVAGGKIELVASRVRPSRKRASAMFTLAEISLLVTVVMSIIFRLRPPSALSHRSPRRTRRASNAACARYAGNPRSPRRGQTLGSGVCRSQEPVLPG
jgi:hypothetical protein